MLAKSKSPATFLSGGGEMGERMRTFDWSRTALGSPDNWPQALKSAVRIMLGSRYQMFIWWGPQLINLYNDAYSSALGNRHPHALGARASDVWQDIWDTVGPQAHQVLYQNCSTWHENQLLIMERNGYTEETFFSYSYSPVCDENDECGGVFCVCTETTEQVIGERRLACLRQLAASTASAKSGSQACELATKSLGDYNRDVPFALVYLVDSDGTHARLCASYGIPSHPRLAPATVNLHEAQSGELWPLRDAQRTTKLKLTDLSVTENLPAGPWPEHTDTAMILPLKGGSQEQPIGFAILGASPRLAFDDKYEGFFELIAQNILSAITNARAYEQERKRSEQLAALDRAKTAFLSNVSHELRTPLTLMLGPLEDLLSFRNGTLPKEAASNVQIAYRNSQRLLKLVNTLLDFARIEAGRVDANYEPTDLAAFTTELASVFRSAIEKAGLTLRLECAPMPEPVYVDRVMWEKIVLNLLSNAFKFTFEGTITVGLRWFGERVELRVSDTGVGIPEADLARVFDRFHRVRGTKSRTHEGTGIGLALVQELARMHGGEVRVRSKEGKGSEFIVSIQTGKAHLPPELIHSPRASIPADTKGFLYADEALRSPANQAIAQSRPRLTDQKAPRILVADDNADMRHYLERLLSDNFAVTAVADGAAALDHVRVHKPDLVLADVMMPNLDGFGLLRALRNDAETRTIPIIMLSARAGEEARLEGLDEGADDYLIKPFSARELVGRIQSQLELAKLRQEGQQRVKQILDSITDGFHAVDAAGRFTEINTAARAMFAAQGVDPNDLMGRHIFEAFPQVYDIDIGHALRQALEKREPSDIEAFYAPWNRWYFLRTRPLPEGGVATFFQDITERKQAESALRESEAHLELVSDMVPTLISYIDREGRYRSCNRAYTEWFALPREDILSRPVREILGEEAWKSIEPSFQQALAGQRVEFETEAKYARGGTRWIHVVYTPHKNAANEVQGIVALVADITPRKHSEEALKRAQDQLRNHAVILEQKVAERTAKLRETVSELESFSYSIAHDMRAPLRSMRGFAEILQSDYSANLGGDAADYLRRICASAERLDRLIQDVLDYSRVVRGDMPLEPVNTAKLVSEIIESYPQFQPPAAEILMQTPLPNVRANPAALTQIFSNLLSNAVKFVTPGQKPRILVRAESRGEVVRLWVEDNGIGISADSVSRIFRLFERLHSPDLYEGTGIGLVIVRKAADRMGGRAGVESTLGQGSRFWVELKAA